VVKNYGYFQRQFTMALEEIAREKPDAVVLIDYPGFNLRLAAALKKAGTPAKLIDYISPQVWAWNRGRIPKMARILDLMICIFPFEKPLYEESGLKTVFVGHPMLDSLAERRTGVAREKDLLGLFPGSREREVRKIYPVMLEAARVLARSRPGLRIEAAAASNEMRERMEEIGRLYPDVRCEVGVKTSHGLMQRATAGMVASGTATLEAAYFGLPYVLIYKAAWLTFAIGRRLVKVKWLGMPNILADREVVREFLQEDARPEAIAEEVGRLLDDEEARANFQVNLRSVISKLGEPGASERAAEAILGELGGPT
jgi:lipid-A-disaccharide synthase